VYYNIYTRVQHLRRPEIQPGGICFSTFCKWEDVEIWPQADPQTGILVTSLVLKPNTTWMRLEPINRGRNFLENPQSDDKGDFVDMSLNGLIPGNNYFLHAAIQSMRYHQYVVIFRERNGMYRMMGDRNSGAEFVWDYNSGDTTTSRSRGVRFLWQSPEPCPIYLGEIPASLDPEQFKPPFASGGDFNDDFNDDFNIYP
jgi:hypothetical protein